MTPPPLPSSAQGSGAPAPTLPLGFTAPVPSLLHAFGGVWRLTIRRYFTTRHALALAGTLALVGLMGWGVLQGRGGIAHYVGWLVGFYVTFLAPLVAFVIAGGAIRDEMKPGTVDYVLIRPVPRPAFIAFKYVAYLVAAEIQFLIAIGVLFLLGIGRHAPGIAAAIPSLVLGQAALVLAASAFGFLCGIVTSRYVIVGLIYGAIVEIGVGQIPTELNKLSMTHQVKAMLVPLITVRGAPYTATIENLEPAGKLATVAILAVFALVALALGAAVFSTRELVSAQDS